MLRQQRQKLIQPWVLNQLIVRQLPRLCKQTVPDTQATVSREHRNCFEQIIERCAAHTQQNIARACKLCLFRAVFEDHEKPAIWNRLRQHAQMRAVRQ